MAIVKSKGVIYMNEDKKSFIVLSLGFATILSIIFILFNIRKNAELLVSYSFIKDILFYLFNMSNKKEYCTIYFSDLFYEFVHVFCDIVCVE